MVITVDEIVQRVNRDFASKYPPFKDFQTGEAHSPYWALCMHALQDRDLLGHIVFCNDLFGIPPVKTFLCYYANQLKTITGREDAKLGDYTKKAIGAVWGFVFKYIFEYAGQKSVSISLKRMFMVTTAACFTTPTKTLVLAY